jgi:outer membrane protein
MSRIFNFATAMTLAALIFQAPALAENSPITPTAPVPAAPVNVVTPPPPVLAPAVKLEPAAPPLAAISSLPATLTTTAPTAAALRIGYVDLLKVGSESIPGKAAELKFKAKVDKYKKQINDKEKQLEKQKKAIEEKLPTMSPEERQTKGKDFEKKLDDYRKFVQKAQKDMEPLQQELSLAMYNIIETAAREYGQAKGLIAIVPKKELLYIGSTVEGVDITDDLLQLVNSRNKEKK